MFSMFFPLHQMHLRMLEKLHLLENYINTLSNYQFPLTQPSPSPQKLHPSPLFMLCCSILHTTPLRRRQYQTLRSTVRPAVPHQPSVHSSAQPNAHMSTQPSVLRLVCPAVCPVSLSVSQWPPVGPEERAAAPITGARRAPRRTMEPICNVWGVTPRIGDGWSAGASEFMLQRRRS